MIYESGASFERGFNLHNKFTGWNNFFYMIYEIKFYLITEYNEIFSVLMFCVSAVVLLSNVLSQTIEIFKIKIQLFYVIQRF